MRGEPLRSQPAEQSCCHRPAHVSAAGSHFSACRRRVEQEPAAGEQEASRKYGEKGRRRDSRKEGASASSSFAGPPGVAMLAVPGAGAAAAAIADMSETVRGVIADARAPRMLAIADVHRGNSGQRRGGCRRRGGGYPWIPGFRGFEATQSSM